MCCLFFSPHLRPVYYIHVMICIPLGVENIFSQMVSDPVCCSWHTGEYVRDMLRDYGFFSPSTTFNYDLYRGHF